MAIIGTVLAGLIVGAEFDVLSCIIPRYHGRKSLGKIYGAIFAVFQFSSASAIYIAGASQSGDRQLFADDECHRRNLPHLHRSVLDDGGRIAISAASTEAKSLRSQPRHCERSEANQGPQV